MKHKDDAAGVMQHKQVAFKADTVRDDGSFTGYASVFGNVDSYGEIVLPGAFAKSLEQLRTSGDPLPVLWQHRSDQPIGGDTAVTEDKTGLRAGGGFLLVDDIPLAKQAHVLMKRKVVKGLSIGYYVVRSQYDEQTGIRSLQELDLREYSIVTFPANTLAQIDSVKQCVREGRLPTLPEFEGFLREAGFSRTQARAIANHGLSKLVSQCEAEQKGDADLLRALADFRLPQL